MKQEKIILLVLFLLVLPVILGVPPIPTEYYGSVTIYDNNRTPMPIGTQIQAYAGNVSCGQFTVSNFGYYGVLSCLGDDDYTATDEGALYGQNIVFSIDNLTAQSFGDSVWYYGEYHMVNLSPIPKCPNSWCEVTESCVTCAEDCNRCPINFTGNGTGTGSGGGATGGAAGGGGGGSASSSGGGGSSGGGNGGAGGTGIIDDASFEICQEDWFCSDWGPELCPIQGIQNRTCEDKNNCNTETQKPDIEQTCVYQGTCIDYYKNQDETDIDCGGLVCEPCNDGKSCLFDFDCKSGFCDPIENICKEPTCNDEFKNQGEEGIDCGGPCPLCEKPTLEKPATILRFISKGCGPFPWFFIVVASVFTILSFIVGKLYIKQIKESKEYKKLRKLEQLIRVYNLNRNFNVLIWIIILLETAISLYLYYFCELGIWILIMIAVIVPLIIAVVIKYYVYDEKRKNKILRKLILKHEDYIKKLIQIERDEIKKEEKKVIDKLGTEVDYKKLDKNLAVLVKDIRFLMKELSNNVEENPFELENTLSDTINQIDEYKESMQADEELSVIYSDLKLIEKIHRDILVQYKELSIDFEIEEELKNKIEIQEKKVEKQEAEKQEVEKQEVEDTNKNITKTLPVEHKPVVLSKYDKIKRELNSKEDKINYLLKLIENQPEDLNILFMLASLYHRMQELDKAEKVYKLIIEKDPKYKAALYYLASLYNQERRLKDSYELYKKIISIDSNYANTKKYYESLKNRFEK